MAQVPPQIPLIDLSALVENTSGKYEVARQMRHAFRNYGFFYMKNHGVDPELEERLEKVGREFFALPIEEKMKIPLELGGRALRGYYPVGHELTGGKPDIKEGIYFGAELPDDHPHVIAGTPIHGKNLFLDSVSGMRTTVLEWIDTMTKLSLRIMDGIALSLDLDENYFSKLFQPTPTPQFRFFHYPAQDEKLVSETGSWGVGEHTDFGFLTVLKQDEVGGLEVKVDGEWIPAPPIPGTFVCNMGDMLEKATGGFYPSNLHRVRCPNVNRISFPFFLDPNFDAVVEPIPNAGKLRQEAQADAKWNRRGVINVYDYSGTYGDFYRARVALMLPQLTADLKVQPTTVV